MAAALFTNAVEILGDRLNLGQGGGSVLAAVGTALPETMIPVVAIVATIFTGSSAAGEVGVGLSRGAVPPCHARDVRRRASVSGAPPPPGERRRRDADREKDREARHGIFPRPLPGRRGRYRAVPFYVKAALALLLLVAYAFYVLRTIKSGGESIEDLPGKLTLWRPGSEAPMWAVAAQLLGPWS